MACKAYPSVVYFILYITPSSGTVTEEAEIGLLRGGVEPVHKPYCLLLIQEEAAI